MTFGKGERGGVFYIPLSSQKIVDSIYASQHCVAFVLGAAQTTTKNQFSHVKIHALDTIQREYKIWIAENVHSGLAIQKIHAFGITILDCKKVNI